MEDVLTSSSRRPRLFNLTVNPWAPFPHYLEVDRVGTQYSDLLCAIHNKLPSLDLVRMGNVKWRRTGTCWVASDAHQSDIWNVDSLRTLGRPEYLADIVEMSSRFPCVTIF